MKRDEVYAEWRSRVGAFEFDDQVADVFPDMISRSVPGYGSVLSLTGQLAGRFARPGSNAYDLGCSLGASTLVIQEQAPSGTAIHAIDSSQAMTSRLEQTLSAQKDGRKRNHVTVHNADILEFDYRNASYAVLNFTLQFVPQDVRREFLDKVRKALMPGGALLLSEKVSFESEDAQKLLTELHHDFKRANGYSDLEISQKRSSLENVLIPETLAAHTARLYGAGFSMVVPLFQCFNFCSILAVNGSHGCA